MGTRTVGLVDGDGRAQVAEMQRSRLLDGAVAAVEELGWSRVTVASIASRSRVSRKTFYDLFSDREDCLLAVLSDTTHRILGELEAADLDGLSWRERVRTGLWTILCFFDREPELARLCVVQSARGGRRVSQWREQIIARLTRVVDEGRCENERASQVPPLSAEGSVGAVLAILHKRLLNSEHERNSARELSGEREPMSDLLGELMGMIVLPYLGAAPARAERTRRAPDRPLVTKTTGPGASEMRAYRAGQDPLKEIPMRLTYRTARVLGAVLTHPGASNRILGEDAGIYDQGQISRLLGRLERLGLAANTGEGQAKGEPNAWHLTPMGERVTQQLSLNTHNHAPGGAHPRRPHRHA
jgi:AcrR family transcriptional regulator/DNA-binding MarR family transcriptional regulator